MEKYQRFQLRVALKEIGGPENDELKKSLENRLLSLREMSH